MAAAKALLVLLATASGYKLTKSNESSISLLEEGELPECKGLPLQGSASGADEWQCDTLHGELGTSDEFKCTNRYDAGVDGKVYLQCAVHAKSNKAFNCLASQRCIPNANAAQGDANRCHCDPATGTAAMGANCKVNLAYECESCLSAFYLASDLHCKRKICTCPSGTGVAAEGADCPTHVAPQDSMDSRVLWAERAGKKTRRSKELRALYLSGDYVPVQGNRPAFALPDRESGSAEASGSGARNQAEDLVEIEVEVASEGSKTESDAGELYIFDSEPRLDLLNRPAPAPVTPAAGRSEGVTAVRDVIRGVPAQVVRDVLHFLRTEAHFFVDDGGDCIKSAVRHAPALLQVSSLNLTADRPEPDWERLETQGTLSGGSSSSDSRRRVQVLRPRSGSLSTKDEITCVRNVVQAWSDEDAAQRQDDWWTEDLVANADQDPALKAQVELSSTGWPRGIGTALLLAQRLARVGHGGNAVVKAMVALATAVATIPAVTGPSAEPRASEVTLCSDRMQGVSTLMLQSGLNQQYWPYAIKYFEFAYNVLSPPSGPAIRNSEEAEVEAPASKYEAAVGYPYEGFLILFGALVWYKEQVAAQDSDYEPEVLEWACFEASQDKANGMANVMAAVHKLLSRKEAEGSEEAQQAIKKEAEGISMLKALWDELGRYIDLEDPEDLDRYLGRYHVVERTVDGAELRTQMGDYAKGISESYYAVEGFRLGAGSTSCLQNVCSCANGNAATGASCDVHDAHKCASCKDSNYQLISNKCEYKTCTCTSGTRAEGSACPAMSDAKCVSCNTGFHMSGVSCKQNVCSCSNGNAATGTSCDVNNEHKCASCVNGDYALISEKCVYKSCKCSNGAASQGSQCDNHNTNECQSCNAGYHEVKSGAKITSCNQNTCSCSNGNAATGASCSSNNAAICASCSNGYQLSGSSCSLRTCTCSHGTGHTGTGCYDHGKESCSSCNSGYELKNIGGRNKCRDPVEETRALIQNRPERVATSWGDPHVKVFDHQWDRAKILSSYHHNWATENLNVMEPGTWWLVKTPGNMVSIQGVYGWGWRAVNRRIAITGKFIKGDRIRVHPRHTHGTPQNDQGCYYKYAGGGDSQLIPNRDHSVNWNNNRNDVTMVYKKSNQGLAGDQWRVHLTMPLYIDLEVNCYNHHVDLVIAMRKIDGQSGDFGNMDGSFSDEMKRNPNVHDRNGWWSKVINGGTRVSHGENIHSNWYDVPPKPHGAVLLEASKRTPNGVVGADDQITVDGVDLNHHDDGTERGLDCTDEQEKAAFHLCHDMLKVNQSVVECMTDVCQQGPRLAAQTNVVEREVEEDEDEETVEHYQIYDGGSLYHTCFHAQDIFTKVSAMPRDVRELNLILALASSRTLLGIRCAGSTWVYVDGAPVPYDIASKATCVDKKLMCVDNTKAEGQQVFTCDSAEKTACQIPRMYACRADVKYEDRDTACPGGMQPAMPVSVRDIGEAQKAMDSDKCTTHQAWTGYVRGPNENPICFYEGGTHTAECSTNADQEKNVMCETKFG
ncbi:unnamed protein product [Effrenium voratum]|nr:unnamed protein product [Effrenium voratum]